MIWFIYEVKRKVLLTNVILFFGGYIMKKEVISRNEFVDMLKKTKGTTFASITYFIDESKSKTINKKKVLQKSVTTNVTLNSDYEKKVNRVMLKQDDPANFKAFEMKGKEQVFPGCRCIVKNAKDEFMLNCVIEHNTNKVTKYFFNGLPITIDEAIKQDLFTPSFFAPKTTAGRGTVDDENDFSVITPKIENIKCATLNSTEYIII